MEQVADSSTVVWEAPKEDIQGKATTMDQDTAYTQAQDIVADVVSQTNHRSRTEIQSSSASLPLRYLRCLRFLLFNEIL